MIRYCVLSVASVQLSYPVRRDIKYIVCTLTTDWPQKTQAMQSSGETESKTDKHRDRQTDRDRQTQAPPYIADLCRPVTSAGSWQRLRSTTRSDLVVSSSAAHFGSHAFALAGPKAWNQLKVHLGALETRDGIKDSSSLHPATVPNCVTCRTLVMTLFMLRRVRNCRCYYYYY